MSTRGLVLGKFMPPHAGHEYLIRFAQSFADDLTIVVGSLEQEPIAGELRFAWMREIFANARVMHLTDALPQTPEEHAEFWAMWKQSLTRLHPEPIDYVFASELYGERLAAELGATFVPVDLDRQVFSISGTKPRADPLANFHFLPPAVRPYFTKRVCVFGPESTGKSTLAKALAEYFRSVCVPEYARTYLEAKQALARVATDTLAPEVELDEHDFLAIARGQIASEEALARRSSGVLIADTDPLLTTI